MNKKFFSIIIPIYNSAKFLNRCIKSIYAQKFKDLQVVLVNDCSTDGSQTMCKKYKKKFKLDLINHKKNLGVAISRNEGIKNAKGKYLIFLDSDDFLLKNSLEQLKKTIEKNNFPEVILNNCERNRVPQNYNHLLKYFDNKIYTNNNFFKILNKNGIILNECWSLVISNKMIKKNKVFFKNIRIAEDQGFVIKILILMKSIIINKNPILFHRSRLDSLKHTLGIESAYSYIVTLEDLCKLLQKYKYSINIKRYLKFRILRIIFYLGAYISLLKKDEIIKLSKRISLSIRQIKKFKNIDYTKSVYSDLENKKTLEIINNHKNFVKNKVIFSLKKTKYKFDGIFIFCADMLAESVVKILKEKKFKINNIYDDDLNFKGKKILNVSIKSLPKNNFEKKDISKKIFLICNLDKKIFFNIKSRLIKKGFFRDRILHLSF